MATHANWKPASNSSMIHLYEKGKVGPKKLTDLGISVTYQSHRKHLLSINEEQLQNRLSEVVELFQLSTHLLLNTVGG